MTVSVCSFGSTGSSAVSDYLRECQNTCVLDSIEFTVVTCTDGLEDLEYYLMKKAARQSGSISAIQRFEAVMRRSKKGLRIRTGISEKTVTKITEDFLDELTQVKYVGPSPMYNKKHSEFIRKYIGISLIEKRIIQKLERKGIIKKNIDFYPLDFVRMAIQPENYYLCAKEFINRLLSGMGADFQKIVVLDQAMSSQDPESSFPFFEDPYAIIVDRDPRDVYIFAKEKLLSKGRFMPSDTVENFIEYYYRLRENQPYKKENKRVLKIQFEDMVYEYENTVKRIDEFLNVVNNNRKTIFIPEMSVANTNLIKKFPQYYEDIKKIETKLPQYLYDFENHEEIQASGGMFFGRSKNNPNQAH